MIGMGKWGKNVGKSGKMLENVGKSGKVWKKVLIARFAILLPYFLVYNAEAYENIFEKDFIILNDFQ